MQEDDYYTIGYNEAELIKPLDGYLTATAAKFSRGKFAVSETDLKTLEGLRAKAIAAVIEQFDAMVATATSRRENLSHFKNIQFLSLGYDCFPRTLLTRWGMKPPAKLGEKTHPFDISIHPSPAVAKVISTDFNGYTDCAFTITGDDNAPTNLELGIRYVHELEPVFAESDFAELRKKYADRVASFQDALKDTRKTVFIHHTDDDNDETRVAVETLFRTVRQKRGGLATSCVWLRTLKPGAIGKHLSLDDTDVVIDVPYPTNNYVWHWNGYAFSKKGHLFELSIITALEKHLSNISWVNIPEVKGLFYTCVRKDWDGSYRMYLDPTDAPIEVGVFSQEGPEEANLSSGFFVGAEEAKAAFVRDVDPNAVFGTVEVLGSP